MNSTGLATVSLLVALSLGFAGSFLVSPDPTGVLPVAAGAGLTGVSFPLIYVGIQRAFALNESST
jgi:hypothetical protein